MTESRSALLVMDFQQGTLARLQIPSVLESAARAVAAARNAGVPVVFVRLGFRPGYPEIAEDHPIFGPTARLAGDAMTESHAATQLHDALEPRPDEPVVVKRRVSAFFGTDLDVLLRANGADALVLAGITTSGVVLSTLRQAADLDYRLTVLEDACADTDADVHRMLMTKLFPRQSVVTTVDDWAESLSAE